MCGKRGSSFPFSLAFEKKDYYWLINKNSNSNWLRAYIINIGKIPLILGNVHKVSSSVVQSACKCFFTILRFTFYAWPLLASPRMVLLDIELCNPNTNVTYQKKNVTLAFCLDLWGGMIIRKVLFNVALKCCSRCSVEALQRCSVAVQKSLFY